MFIYPAEVSFFELKDIEEFACLLNGIRFSRQDFLKAFERVGEYISGALPCQIVDKMFE